MAASRRWLCAVVLSLCAHGAGAQSVADLNDQTVAAFTAEGRAAALDINARAITQAASDPSAQPAAVLQALNNRSFLLMNGSDPDALHAARMAARFADEGGLLHSYGWMTAYGFLANAAAMAGEADASRVARRTLLEAARDTEFHGWALGSALDAAFVTEDFDDLRYWTEEQIAVQGRYQAKTGIDAIYARQSKAEADGDIDALTHLVHTRIAIFVSADPASKASITQTLIWPLFSQNYQAARYGAAADALRDWVHSGVLSDDETEFVRSQADATLEIIQRNGFSENAGRQLGFAELVLAFAELGYGLRDHRVGLALRERASVRADLGQYDLARADLQKALGILTASPAGVPHVFLVLESLASNAWQRGDLPGARAFFDRADDARQEALAAGVTPLGAFDQGTLLLNRARLSLDMEDSTRAEAELADAAMLLQRHLQSGSAKPHDFRVIVDLKQSQARLAALMQDTETAIAAAKLTAQAARDIYDGPHPAKARALVNTADQLLVLGANGPARDLLDEAMQIARTSLPDDAPMRVEIDVKLAVDALQQQDRDRAITHLVAATEGRKSALYRGELPDAALNFEILVWTLLAQKDATPEDVDAAVRALQWTHVSRSADALAMMQTRLASASGSDAALLKRRQDLLDQLTRSRADLGTAYAQGADVTPLLARQTALRADLDDADLALVEAGLELTGPAPVAELGLRDVQALLRPGEMVVTFALPGLKPEMIPGIAQSSNIAIAIWDDGYQIAPVREASRGALRERITAFRCEMALSDPGCDTPSLLALRSGALPEWTRPGAAQASGFDHGLAHALYLDLFGGLGPEMAQTDKLIIVPPGDLLRLPFQALMTAPASDRSAAAPLPWLIRSHAVSVLPSLPALATLRGRSVPDRDVTRYLGIGDPEIGRAGDLDCASINLAALRSAGQWGSLPFGSEWQDGVRLAKPPVLRALARLPDATCELEAIGAQFAPSERLVLTRAEANERTLKDLSKTGVLAQQDIVVFATHGLVAGEASAVSPGLVLTPPSRATVRDDGLLTSAEVATLSLNARLIILSACNTAAGEDATQDGLSGLASSFFHAGARALVVTHWAVFSTASAEISAGVAGRIAADPALENARALQQVTLALLDDPGSPPLRQHPAYWAAFAVIGD